MGVASPVRRCSECYRWRVIFFYYYRSGDGSTLRLHRRCVTCGRRAAAYRRSEDAILNPDPAPD